MHRGGLLRAEPRRALNCCLHGRSGGRSNIFFALTLSGQRVRGRAAGAAGAGDATTKQAAPLLPDDLMFPYGYLNLASPLKTLQSVTSMHEL